MEHSIPNIETSKVYSLSIMAYVRPAFVFIISFILSIILSQVNNLIVSMIGYLLIIGAVVNLYVSVLYLRTIKFYINEDGVFLFRGVFPWTKGIVGTLWHDISDANYFTGFINWATSSYRIRVGHRFTKTSELTINNLKDGNLAVMEINEIVKNKARRNNI